MQNYINQEKEKAVVIGLITKDCPQSQLEDNFSELEFLALTADVECLTNAARTAALKSSFSKISGNKAEGGKITYTFVRQ